MPYLLISHSRRPLAAGRSLLVRGAEGAIAIVDEAAAERAAEDASDAAATPLLAIDVTEAGIATARRLSPGEEILVDGVALGEAPVAMIHGTKVEVPGHRMVFGDEGAGGETDRRLEVPDDDNLLPDDPLPSAPTAAEGGVLVSLADGRRYAIPEHGLEIGRDPNCDLVLASPDASRWHASIGPSLFGYVIRDTSSNGVFINGRRIDEQRVLGRDDIVRIGSEEFRFEAAPARLEPSTSLRLAAMSDSPGAAPPSPASGPARAAESAAPAGRVSGASTQSPLLATLEVIGGGLLGGRRFRIEHPLSHVGRGAHNEVLLGDESVSGSHATLRRRGREWIVADQGSRNGTYVDGQRVDGERVLSGPCELRFGGVRTVFRPIAGGAPDTDETRGIVGVALGEKA